MLISRAAILERYNYSLTRNAVENMGFLCFLSFVELY
jgi:hypothetical protein